MRIHPFRAALALFLAGASLLAAPLLRAQEADTSAVTKAQEERPHGSNKWRIVFDGRANSDGTITFRIWPLASEPIRIDISVVDGQSENHIAKSARDALRFGLGKGFHVEVDDGEDVLVKAKHGTGDFGLQLLGNTARDVDISLRSE